MKLFTTAVMQMCPQILPRPQSFKKDTFAWRVWSKLTEVKRDTDYDLVLAAKYYRLTKH